MPVATFSLVQRLEDERPKDLNPKVELVLQCFYTFPSELADIHIILYRVEFEALSFKDRAFLFSKKYDFNTPKYPLIKWMRYDKKKFFNTYT